MSWKGKKNLNNLHDLRKKAGLSQSQLAYLSGVKIRTIQNYESGYRDIRKACYDILTRLSTALNCSIDDLVS
jgi:transcriptional regulator with XRE-family HTH domain